MDQENAKITQNKDREDVKTHFFTEQDQDACIHLHLQEVGYMTTYCWNIRSFSDRLFTRSVIWTKSSYPILAIAYLLLTSAFHSQYSQRHANTGLGTMWSILSYLYFTPYLNSQHLIYLSDPVRQLLSLHVCLLVSLGFPTS